MTFALLFRLYGNFFNLICMVFAFLSFKALAFFLSYMGVAFCI